MQIKLLQGASTVWMREAVCDMAQFLYQTIEALEQAGFLQDMPDFIEQGLSERIDLRDCVLQDQFPCLCKVILQHPPTGNFTRCNPLSVNP